eukprot:6482219-Amphidinium_carterae.1
MSELSEGDVEFPSKILLVSRTWYVFTDVCAEWTKDGTMMIHLGAVLFQEDESTPNASGKVYLEGDAVWGAGVLVHMGVKAVLARGLAHEPEMRIILVESFREDLRAQSLNFYSWVPSEVNIADAPSRGDV